MRFPPGPWWLSKPGNEPLKRPQHVWFAQDHQRPADEPERWYQLRPCLLRIAAAMPDFISSTVTPFRLRTRPAATTAARISASELGRPLETTSWPCSSKLHTMLSPA